MAQTSYSIDPPIAREGDLADMNAMDATSRLAGADASDNPIGIDVGRLIVFDPDATNADYQKAYLPTAAADVTGFAVGVSYRDNSVEPTDGTDPLYADGDKVPILKKGRIWVVCENILTAATMNSVYVRHVAGGAEQLGAFRSTADSTDATVLPGARWLTTTSAINSLALLEVNLP